MMNPRRELLDHIRALEFMAVELNLYLNSHPYDRRALYEYNCYTQQLRVLKDEFQRRYGTLTNFGNQVSQYAWSWINDPWPWEEDYWKEDY